MKLKQLSPTAFMLLLVTLSAGFVRLAVVADSPMPLNDGGLFYQMIADLQANGYRLPVFTTYNNDSLPFAYPPLAFYIGGFLQHLSGLALLDVVRLLPPVVSIFAIPIFYLLAKDITQNETLAFFASLCFAFLPLAFSWQIMGGGLTRALGQIFALLTMLSTLRLYRDTSRRALFSTSLWGTLVVLTHPEAALQSVLAVGVLFLFYGRSWQALRASLLVAGLVLLFSSPWWATILARFGISPFLAVATAASQNTVPLLARLFFLFRLNITEEPFITFIACLGILGFFFSLARRNYLLPVWFLATILIDSRSGIRFATIPLAMLSGIMLYEIIALLKIEIISETKIKNLQQAITSTPIRRIFFGYLFIAMIAGAFFTLTTLRTNLTVSQSEQNAARWIQSNTPPTSTIATITQERPLLDPFTEWLPVLAKRKVVTNAFGYEWLYNDMSFQNRLTAYQKAQECANKDAECLKNWMEEHRRVDYFVLCMGISSENADLPLRIWLLNTSGFTQVYYKDNVAIFRVNHE